MKLEYSMSVDLASEDDIRKYPEYVCCSNRVHQQPVFMGLQDIITAPNGARGGVMKCPYRGCDTRTVMSVSKLVRDGVISTEWCIRLKIPPVFKLALREGWRNCERGILHSRKLEAMERLMNVEVDQERIIAVIYGRPRVHQEVYSPTLAEAVPVTFSDGTEMKMFSPKQVREAIAAAEQWAHQVQIDTLKEFADKNAEARTESL